MQSLVNMGQFILNHLEQRVYQIGIRLWIVWPWMTSNDLAFNFFEKTSSKVSWRPKLIDFRKNDPHRSEIKFYSMIIFMTHSAVSYQKRIFRLKSKIWPKKTPFVDSITFWTDPRKFKNHRVPFPLSSHFP